jgi:CRP-like cAMP-binding protein
VSKPSPHNQILASLPADILVRLWPDLSLVELAPRMVIETPHLISRYAYFPERGVVCAIASVGHDCQMNVGLIGREGFIGQSGILGDGYPAILMQVQMPASAWRIDIELLKRHAASSRYLAIALNRFLAAFSVQLSMISLASRLRIEERVAGWLLMLDDRVGGGDLDLTHEALASMLGLRRAGVSTVLGQFCKSGAIRMGRRRITIVSRPELEACAARCYGASEAEARRLVGSQAVHAAPAWPPLVA